MLAFHLNTRLKAKGTSGYDLPYSNVKHKTSLGTFEYHHPYMDTLTQIKHHIRILPCHIRMPHPHI